MWSFLILSSGDMYSGFLLIYSSLSDYGPAKRLSVLKQLKYVCVYCCLRLITVPYSYKFLWGLNNCGFCEVFLSMKNY